MHAYRQQKVVIYKTACYSFYLSVALLMYITGIPHTAQNDPYALAQSILIPLGEYFQVQDDFLDFAQPPELLGKIGMGIVDNKCSWCVNTALALASHAQRKVLDDNYGRKDAAAEARVKALYKEPGIRGRLAAYEEAAYKRILAAHRDHPGETTGEGGRGRALAQGVQGLPRQDLQAAEVSGRYVEGSAGRHTDVMCI